MFQDSDNNYEKQRHGFLTVWLIFIIITSSISIMAVGFRAPILADTLPGWQIVFSIFMNMVNIVCAVALFRWKKWGFWGFCASAVISFFVSIIVGEFIILALVLLAVQLFILYWALTIGGENEAWYQLE